LCEVFINLYAYLSHTNAKKTHIMKKILFLLAMGIFLNVNLQAQIRLFLEEQEVKLPDGTSTAWVFPVVRDLDEALEDLKEYCKDRGDVKMKKGGDNILIAEMVSLPAISTKRGDLIGMGFITEQYYALAIVFQLGYDISLNSKDWKVEMGNLRNYSKNFMAYHYEQSYARKLEVLNKEIDDLEKEKKQNNNKIDNLTDKINNLSKKIGKEEDTAKIEEFEAEINTLEADMKVLMDALPGLEATIADRMSKQAQLQSESNSYQSIIGTL
jgi:chaperonin cofactor prefoldin